MKQARVLILKYLLLFTTSFFFSTTLYASSNIEGIQIYQKNMHLSEEHKQMLAADIYRYYKADNIWDTLRHEFVLPHYEYMPQVQAQINWFLRHQDFLLTSANRAAPYLYYILQQVRKRHLPPELVLLPIIESSYNPFAYSNRGAAGIWQIMPGTAAGFGVKQNWWYDGRRDLITSTRTALDYLSYLGSFFGGNWLLAIAAYDTGEGNILSAVKKNIKVGMSTDFWTLPLIQETRDYIPRLLALAIIISYPDRYPILFPPIRNAPYLAQIDIGGQIELKQAASLAGLSLKKLMQLNPAFNRSSTDPNGPFKLILPIEHVQRFSENLEQVAFPPPTTRLHRYTIKLGASTVPSPYQSKSSIGKNPTPQYKPREYVDNNIFIVKDLRTSTKSVTNTITNTLTNLQGKYSLQPGDTLYMIREGDNIEKISRRFHVESKTVLAVNQMNPQSRMVPGEKMIIPTHLIQTSSLKTYPQTTGETIYMVKQGENLDAIAQKFHTTPTELRNANLLTSNEVRVGDRLVIPQVG